MNNYLPNQHARPMKRALLPNIYVRISGFALALLLSVSIAKAQNEEGTSVGIKAGINLANLYIDNVDDENAKVGFHGGLYVKSKIITPLSIQIELLYSMKGAQVNYKPSLLTNGGKFRYNLSYLDLPVLAVINLGKSFNVHAGPYVSYLLAVKVKNIDSQGNTNSITELDRDNFNSVDYGLIGGIGFDFKAGTIGFRYNYGLKEIGNSANAREATANSKNSVLQAYIGFGF